MVPKVRTIEEFMELDLLQAVGLGDAPGDVKQEFVDRARAEILGAVAKKVEDGLTPDKKVEFARLFDDDSVSNEERENFIKDNIPDFEELVLKEALLFKKQALDAAHSLNV